MIQLCDICSNHSPICFSFTLTSQPGHPDFQLALLLCFVGGTFAEALVLRSQEHYC
jgi:hypothetical protein